jgi:hypothetical protein
VDSQVGAIRVPATHTGITLPRNRVELLDAPVSCDQPPVFTAYFTQAGANQKEPGVYEFNGSLQPIDPVACSAVDAAGREFADTTGVEVRFFGS